MLITSPFMRILVPMVFLFFILFGSSNEIQAAKYSPENLDNFAFQTPRTAFVPNQVLVKMQGDRDAQSVKSLKSSRILSVKKAVFGFSVFQIDGDVEGACEELRSDPHIESAEPNYFRYCSIIPNDPRWASQKNLNLSRAPEGWDIETGKSDVVVAVIDTGVDYNHPELQPNLLPGKNFREAADYIDDSGHGTAVTGIIGAVGNNEVGIAGSAWNIRILPLRACGGSELACSVLDVAESVEEAIVQGADVINMSIGGFNSSAVEKKAIEAAWNAGIVIIAAAGNDGKLGKFGDPELEHNITYPAGYENVCGVSSIDYPVAGDLSQVQLSDFSNYGDMVSVTAVGSRVVTTAPTFDVVYPIFKSKNYVTINGTSLSAPLVSGLASLLKSHFPSMTNREIRTRIEKAVWDLGQPGWDDQFGYGLVDFQIALLGGLYASNEVFNLGVTSSPIISDDIAIIVKVKQQLIGKPSVYYIAMGQIGPVQSGPIPIIALDWNPDIYVGRLHTSHIGGIIIKVNGNSTSGPVPELVLEYLKM